MNDIDKKILDILKNDSRISAGAIAAMLGMEESEVAKRIEDMQDSGVLVKYTAVINSELTQDESVTALIEVKVTPQSTHGFDNIAREIMAYEEVSSVYLMSGAYDLVVIVEGKTIKQVAGFISEKLSVMENVLSTATHFILKKYKSEGIILDKKYTKKREVIA
ncbi:MAG: Lrp/AsnC family transcriptional regulator [Clostridia bacterium]|nr:Lrp/AsnC family transcriptional regulator [Clostridia bacterium]MDY4083028.1 Lrp/AsnC family transcriptional regulator [Eubacteriales bacterium]